MTSRTLYDMFLETVRAHSDSPAVGTRKSRTAQVETITYNELQAAVTKMQRALHGLGLQQGDRFALMFHDNRAEWAIADLASQALGVITVPIYGTLPASQVEFYLRDSDAAAIFVSDAKQRLKVEQVRGNLPHLKTIISLEQADETQGWLNYHELLERQGATADELATLARQVKPDDIATLIYTSGTTGDPRGAMLTHMNMLQTCDGVISDHIADLGPGDVMLSFLPLSHITERSGGQYMPIRMGACIVYSLGLLALTDEIQKSVRPTVLLCVPRLWESMHERFLDAVQKFEPRKRKLVEWAITVGEETAALRSRGKVIGPLLRAQHALAERLVLGNVRAQVTGGRLRYCVSGGAPLKPATARFFLGIGIQILEGYGMSECNIIAINRPNRQRIGTVGNIMPGTEIKFAQDGEILVRGQGRTPGYFNQPEATATTIDEEGWFHTGDIGEMSPDGYLSITDRKKDLLVLSNGKKVAPQLIEAQLKNSPYITEAVLFGDNQPTVVALLVPSFERLQEWATANSVAASSPSELLKLPEITKLFKKEIENCSRDLADFERVRDFRLAPQPFGIESGELTPTLKVKRKFVANKYSDLITSMMRG